MHFKYRTAYADRYTRISSAKLAILSNRNIPKAEPQTFSWVFISMPLSKLTQVVSVISRLNIHLQAQLPRETSPHLVEKPSNN
jgi:hypothetical protein